MTRRIRYGLASGALIALIAVAYGPAQQLRRFFLTPCAAEGPAREAELDIDPQPVDVARLYSELRSAATGFTEEELARVEYGGESMPILLFSRAPAASRSSLLVVAGVHGNEVSGSLAAREVLRTRMPEALALHLLAPANPVGLKQGSRYNAQGCDINRDFSDYRTAEARAIRRAIERVQPEIVISLHEGPQDGIFLIATQITPESMLSAMIAALEERGFPLARENNLGVGLDTPGTMLEGAFITRAKAWLGIHSLGEYTTSLGIPLITTEAPWKLPSVAQRIEMHQVALAALVRELSR